MTASSVQVASSVAPRVVASKPTCGRGFRLYGVLTRPLRPHQRCALFARLPGVLQRACWRGLSAELERYREQSP